MWGRVCCGEGKEGLRPGLALKPFPLHQGEGLHLIILEPLTFKENGLLVDASVFKQEATQRLQGPEGFMLFQSWKDSGLTR